jgi:FkbM family methyltransferase
LNRQELAISVIKLGRRLVADTPLQRLQVTGYLYDKVFRFGYGEGDVTTRFRSLSVTLPARDVTVAPGVIGGFYERIELDLFERLAAASRVIVDVGGNVGLYACLGAGRMPPGGRLIVFEPVRGNLRYLERNLEQNHVQGVRVEALAVGEADGEATIYLVPRSVGTHSMSARNAEGSAHGVVVPMVSLDSYLTGRRVAAVDVVKVDVEGYEGFVLRGARATLRRSRPALLLAFSPRQLLNCGFAPGELLDLILANYGEVYLINEPDRSIRRCGEEDLDLLRRGTHDPMGTNLVAAARPDHVAIVHELMQGQGR